MPSLDFLFLSDPYMILCNTGAPNLHMIHVHMISAKMHNSVTIYERAIGGHFTHGASQKISGRERL